MCLEINTSFWFGFGESTDRSISRIVRGIETSQAVVRRTDCPDGCDENPCYLDRGLDVAYAEVKLHGGLACTGTDGRSVFWRCDSCGKRYSSPVGDGEDALLTELQTPIIAVG